MRRPLCPAVVLALSLPLSAADPPPKPADEAEFEARFADDSVVKLAVLEPVVTVATRYGKLTVPLSEIKRVEVGFRYPEGVEAKVEAAAADLGSADFHKRDAAEKALVGFGEYAVAAVKAATKSPDVEVAKRADAILAKLREKLPAEKLARKPEDVIETDAFTLRGRIEGPTLKVRTRYFGETSLRLAEVRSLRAVAAGGGSGTLAMDAAKFARQGWAEWLDTGIDVSADEPLEVTATGQIDQWSQTPGQYMSGPQGTGAQAQGFPAVKGAAVPPAGVPAGGRAYLSGAIYGRVGDGAPFLVGASYKTTKPTGSGRLYLIIGPSNWGNECVGSYEVRVKAGG